MSENKLTRREKEFLDCYFLCGDVKEAYREVYGGLYRRRSVDEFAFRLGKNILLKDSAAEYLASRRCDKGELLNSALSVFLSLARDESASESIRLKAAENLVSLAAAEKREQNGAGNVTFELSGGGFDE